MVFYNAKKNFNKNALFVVFYAKTVLLYTPHQNSLNNHKIGVILMSMLETLLTVLSAVSTVCAIIFGYSAYKRNSNADVSSHAAKNATFLSEIGYIKANTDEIKAEQKEQRKTNTEFVSRLTAVEESVRQAHKRINELKSESHHKE